MIDCVIGNLFSVWPKVEVAICTVDFIYEHGTKLQSFYSCWRYNQIPIPFQKWKKVYIITYYFKIVNPFLRPPNLMGSLAWNNYCKILPYSPMLLLSKTGKSNGWRIVLKPNKKINVKTLGQYQIFA